MVVSPGEHNNKFILYIVINCVVIYIYIYIYFISASKARILSKIRFNETRFLTSQYLYALSSKQGREGDYGPHFTIE